MMPHVAQTPNAETILADLTFMVAGWDELPQKVVFEVRAFKEGNSPQTAKFSPDWLDEAVEWIAAMNSRGYNCYAVRNPIRHDIIGSATDADIVAAFFLWADCDDKKAGDNVLRFDGPKWSAAVTTGTIPETRVHVYWRLQEPVSDMAAWRDVQRRIASHFESDQSVINPSRIMRIAGTVSYPAQQKQNKGYCSELVGLRTTYDPPRSPVGFDQMRRVFPSIANPINGPHIDTGEMPSLDRERTAIKAMTGEEWNTNVFKLVGSYVRKGMSDAEILALVEPLTTSGYTVADTREEVQAMIDRTRANPAFEGAGQDEQPEPVKPTPEAIADFRIDSSDEFLADLEPLEYLIEGVLPRGVVYSLTGHAGHGKTTLALQFALSVATGEEFAGRECAQGSVLILAGENPYNVKYQYAAALAARGIKSADIHFVQGRFSIDQWSEVLRTKMAQMPNLKLVIVDSLQAFFEGDNDNDNSQMVTMAHKIRALGSVDARPAMLIIAHPAGKTPQKDNLVPRGGGAFLNEIDGNLTIWSQDASQQTLHHSQKFRGAGFDPLEFVMQVHEFDHLTDIKGTPLKLPVSRPEMSIERANREVQTNTLLTRYLELVEQKRAPSEREAATLWGVSRRRVRSVIETAKEEKLIKRYARTYAITDGGKAFLEDQNAGE